MDLGAILKILLPLLPGIIEALMSFLKGLDERERGELVDQVIKVLEQVLKGLPKREIGFGNAGGVSGPPGG